MSWKGVTVDEQRQNFIRAWSHATRAARTCFRDYRLNIYTITELAQRFSISRKTAYKWIHRWERHGEDGVQRSHIITAFACAKPAPIPPPLRVSGPHLAGQLGVMSQKLARVDRSFDVQRNLQRVV